MTIIACEGTIGGLGKGANVTFIAGQSSGAKDQQSDSGLKSHGPGLRVGSTWIGFAMNGTRTRNTIGYGIILREESSDAIIGAGEERTFVGNCQFHGITLSAPRAKLNHLSLGVTPHQDPAPCYSTSLKIDSTAINATVGLDRAPFRTYVDNCCGDPITNSFYSVISVAAPGFTMVNTDLGVDTRQNGSGLTKIGDRDTIGDSAGLVIEESAVDARIGIDGSPSLTRLRATSGFREYLMKIRAAGTVITNVVIGALSTLDACSIEKSQVIPGGAAVVFYASAINSRFGTDGSPNRTYLEASSLKGILVAASNVTIVNFEVRAIDRRIITPLIPPFSPPPSSLFYSVLRSSASYSSKDFFILSLLRLRRSHACIFNNLCIFCQ